MPSSCAITASTSLESVLVPGFRENNGIAGHRKSIGLFRNARCGAFPSREIFTPAFRAKAEARSKQFSDSSGVTSGVAQTPIKPRQAAINKVRRHEAELGVKYFAPQLRPEKWREGSAHWPESKLLPEQQLKLSFDELSNGDMAARHAPWRTSGIE